MIFRAAVSLFLLAPALGAAAAAPAVFPHPVLERWKGPPDARLPRQAAEELLALTDAQAVALVPDQTPQITDLCPVCARKTPQGVLRQGVKLFPHEFDPLHPDHLRCRNCGTTWPNPQLPPSGSETFRNLQGRDIAVPYWDFAGVPRQPRERDAGKPHRAYVQGFVDTARRLWLAPRLDALAGMYRNTHDERYARRLILMLHEFARRYPGWLLTTDYGFRYTTTQGQQPPYGYIETRWGRRAPDDLPQSLLELFDLAASSPAMDRSTKREIIENLFLDPIRRDELRQSLSADAYYGNECPLKALAERALVLEDPPRVHAAYQLIRQAPHYATACDGMYHQSMGYSSLFRLTFFEGARVLDGYRDPPGYVGPDGLHLEDIHPMKEMEDYYYQLDNAFEQLRLPSGGWLTYDDSGPGFGARWWAGDGKSCRPLASSRCAMLPGLRRAVLGAGAGDRQIQAALDFAEHGVNHGHPSGLTLHLFAFGHSLIDPFPYHKSVLRSYGASTVSHPTVIIDQQNQNDKCTDGEVQMYAPGMDGVAAICVDDPRAYDTCAKRYRRTLVLNSIDPDAPYVVDLFEVAGGATHDYRLRSPSQHHCTGTASLPTQPLPGRRPLLPPGAAWQEPRNWGEQIECLYGVFANVRHAAISGPFHFDSMCVDPWKVVTPDEVTDRELQPPVGAWLAGPDSWPDRPAVGIRHHVAVGPGYEFLDFTSPSLVEEGFHGTEGKPTDQWIQIPDRIVRHAVRDGQPSLFVVVHEPWHHAAKILSVARLDAGQEDLVALQITLPGRTDTVLCTLDKPRTVRVGDVEMIGRLAVVAHTAGVAPRGYLVEGTRLKADGVDLQSETSAYMGEITAAQRDWLGQGVNRLRVEIASQTTPLPLGDALRGTWMIVKLGAWSGGTTGAHAARQPKHYASASQAVQIDRITAQSDGYWIDTQGDHGLEIDADRTAEFYWPRRTFAGRPGFVIPTAVSTHPLPQRPRPVPLAVAPLASGPGTPRPGVQITAFHGPGHDLRTQTRDSDAVLERPVESALTRRVSDMEMPGGLSVAGWLPVPADGLYTLHAGAADEYRLLLNNVPVIETFRGHDWMPAAKSLQLRRGWYMVELQCFRQGRQRGQPWSTLDWEGPDFSRTELLPALRVAD